MRRTPQDSLAFARPIRLKRGPVREVATVRDGAILILALDQPRQQKVIWERAAKMLMRAVATRRRIDVARAQLHLMLALCSERWSG